MDTKHSSYLGSLFFIVYNRVDSKGGQAYNKSERGKDGNLPDSRGMDGYAAAGVQVRVQSEAEEAGGGFKPTIVGRERSGSIPVKGRTISEARDVAEIDAKVINVFLFTTSHHCGMFP